MRPLIVEAKANRQRRVIEADFEGKVCDILRKNGIEPLKADATEGWPDRYIRGGHWIEFKQDVFGSRKFSAYRQIDLAQANMMRALTAQGDKCFVCIVYVDTVNGGRWVLWAEWQDFYDRFKGHKVAPWAIPHLPCFMKYDDFMDYMANRFPQRIGVRNDT